MRNRYSRSRKENPIPSSYLFFSVVLIGMVFIFVLLIKYPPYEGNQPIAIKENMTLRHISERNDVPLESLISLLNSDDRKDFITTFKNVHKPLSEHSIDREQIRAVIMEARAKGFPLKDLIRYVFWAVVVVSAGILLLRRRRIREIRRVWLIFTFVVFGIILGSSPNPMEAMVRFHKLINGIPGNPLVLVILSFVILTLLSLLGSRLICSWGCPLGALQETLHNIPIFKRYKKNNKFSFAASIAIRITLYLVFVLLLFSVLNINQGGPGSIFYHHFNLFKIFNPSELAQFTLLLIPVFLVTSLFVFRPFCHTVCPFGLWAWFLERASLFKIRKVNPDACVDCRNCEEACPTEAMKAINENKNGLFTPDCWSCGRCLDACPQNVIEYARKNTSVPL